MSKKLMKFTLLMALVMMLITNAAYSAEPLPESVQVLTSNLKKETIRDSFTVFLEKRPEPVAANLVEETATNFKSDQKYPYKKEFDGSRVDAVKKACSNVLDVFGRAQQFKFCVIESPFPIIGTYKGCIIVISSGLIQISSKEELAAGVAHELSHECFEKELFEAYQSGDKNRMHEVELKCDVVAYVGLRLIGIKGENLSNLVLKIERFFTTKGYNQKDDTHPEGSQRAELVVRLNELLH